MSVIAFDGKIIAADKQATNNGLKVACTKLMRHNTSFNGTQCIIGWTGSIDGGLMLQDWYLAGAKKDDWPKFQSTDDWVRLIVFDVELFFYETLPVKMRIEHPFMAWGHGRSFAMGAMAAGKNAIEAVEIASCLCDSCGCGVTWFSV